jgi:hypothetical protein
VPVADRTHVDWEEAYARYSSQLRQYEDFLQSFEKEHGIDLSPGAYEMIIVPLIELLEDGDTLDIGMVRNTMEKLVMEMAATPSYRDEHLKKNQNKKRRSSWSVIKAYWKCWCTIPPICDPTEKP